MNNAVADNANPLVYAASSLNRAKIPFSELLLDSSLERDCIDAEEIFGLIRRISDPEHPSLSLEQLKVLSPDLITVDNDKHQVAVTFTPTISHCSQATTIGLMLRVKLARCLPMRYKIDVKITPGTHMTEELINKQLCDKERVAAAVENPGLAGLISKTLADADSWEDVVCLVDED